MTNPTDTNQASEDELRTLDEILSQAFTDGASDTMWQDERHIEIFATAKKELQAIIRNEKLKLLAEVREQTTIFKIEAHDKKGQPHLYEAGRGVPIEVLNKLEAEM